MELGVIGQLLIVYYYAINIIECYSTVPSTKWMNIRKLHELKIYFCCQRNDHVNKRLLNACNRKSVLYAVNESIWPYMHWNTPSRPHDAVPFFPTQNRDGKEERKNYRAEQVCETILSMRTQYTAIAVAANMLRRMNTKSDGMHAKRKLTNTARDNLFRAGQQKPHAVAFQRDISQMCNK